MSSADPDLISLLLKNQGLHCLPFNLHLLKEKKKRERERDYKIDILGYYGNYYCVPIFNKFTIIEFEKMATLQQQTVQHSSKIKGHSVICFIYGCI